MSLIKTSITSHFADIHIIILQPTYRLKMQNFLEVAWSYYCITKTLASNPNSVMIIHCLNRSSSIQNTKQRLEWQYWFDVSRRFKIYNTLHFQASGERIKYKCLEVIFFASVSRVCTVNGNCGLAARDPARCLIME